MTRLSCCRSALRGTFLAIGISLLFSFASATVAIAQRGLVRPAGVAHGSAPHVVGSANFRRRPIYPVRPISSIFAPPRFLFWSTPLYGSGLGFHWNRFCPYGGGGYDCYNLPIFAYGGGERELPQLYIKDGTVYDVTDYWVVENKLHFTTIDESGTKWNEHTVDFSQLDLQKTIDVAQQRGFRFVLRDEPMQQYFQDHPNFGESGALPDLPKSPTFTPQRNSGP